MMIFLITWFILHPFVHAQTWKPALVLPTTGTSSSLMYPKLNVGLGEFNRLFRSSTDYIIRRECPQCATTHQVMYYRRLTNVDTFDVHSSMILWESLNNVQGVDFNLYSTLDDALNDQNAWANVCNYDDFTTSGGVGAFRDCGPTTAVTMNWCAALETSRECRFSILNPDSHGCSNPSASMGWQVNGTAIYACRGTIAQGAGGVYGLDAAAICNKRGGYHVCESGEEVAALGLTNDTCFTIGGGSDFYATKETTIAASYDCHADEPDMVGRNLIWGCTVASTIANGVPGRQCGGLSGIIEDDWGYWTTPGTLTGNASASAYLSDVAGGGVLCCPEESCQPTFVGVPCVVTGDPHFTQWNSAKHDFQGQPSSFENMFYYIQRCPGFTSDDMPFAVLGTHASVGTSSVTGLDYITVLLTESNGDEYQLFLSSSIHQYTMNRNSATNTVLQSNVLEQIGLKFEVLYVQTGDRIDVALTIDSFCTVHFNMIAQSNFNSSLNRYQMHYLQITQSECYKCYTCGLCGDFNTTATGETYEKLQTCHGKVMQFREGSHEAITEAYDLNGWSYGKTYYDTNCAQTNIDYTPDAGQSFAYVDGCDASIKPAVATECAAARTAQASCCALIGEARCDHYESMCVIDACVAVGTDSSAITAEVKKIFTDAVTTCCTLPDPDMLFSSNNLPPTASPTPAPTASPTYTQCGFKGVPCTVAGFNHFTLWNGEAHDFQGQPETGKEQFYYIHPCDGSNNTDMPFNVLGTHVKRNTSSATSLDYITLELFEGNNAWYVWLSASIHSWTLNDGSWSTVYDGTATDLVSDDVITIGTRFQLMYTQITDTVIEAMLVVDDTCSLRLRMNGYSYFEDNRWKMHHLVIAPTECYKCVTCGLCGDFKRVAQKSDYERLETCDGSYVSYRSGSSEGITEAFDEDGMSWERSYVQNHCQGDEGSTTPYVPNTTGFTFLATICSASVTKEIVTACTTAYYNSTFNYTGCCTRDPDDKSYCDGIFNGCNKDVCAKIGGDASKIDAAVADVFTKQITAMCATVASLADGDTQWFRWTNTGQGFPQNLVIPPTVNEISWPPTPAPTHAQCGFIGNPCVVHGSNHFTLWNGAHHDFQGQPSTGKEQFYYIYPCDGSDNTDMPFNVLGTHVNIGTQSVTSLDYITLELFETSGSFYVWLSASIHSWALNDGSWSTLYDANTASTPTDLVSGAETSIGTRFKLTYTQVTDTTITATLLVDGTCPLTLHMAAQQYFVDNRWKEHHLTIEPTDCYKCVTCGLCGDFKRVAQNESDYDRLETCDGSYVTYRSGSSEGIIEAFDVYGMSWEQSYVEDNCQGDVGSTTLYVPNTTGFTFLATMCSASVTKEIVTACTSAYYNATFNVTKCCGDPDSKSQCDSFFNYCKMDVCAKIGGDASKIDAAVADVFTKPITSLCYTSIADDGTQWFRSSPQNLVIPPTVNEITWPPTLSPTTASPTSVPTSPPVTASPTSSPVTASPTSSPVTASPTSSPISPTSPTIVVSSVESGSNSYSVTFIPMAVFVFFVL
eukprot:738785_1